VTEVPGLRIRDERLEVSRTYLGEPVVVPVRVVEAGKPGPVLLITAAIHGDEINGTGILHDLMVDDPPALVRGRLVMVPVANVFGFEAQDRYMPDRRDLNRCFPGDPHGSLARRVAHVIFHELVLRCDYAVDLHTAATGRTNFPTARGDLRDPEVRRLARAFGCELIINSRGPAGALRRAATEAGRPTILFEAGETSKVEGAVVRVGSRGLRNVLVELGMTEGRPRRPAYQTRVDQTRWVRAVQGGILRFHVSLGDPVSKGEPIATNVDVLGNAQHVVRSPFDGVVLGMTTLPAVKPGEPICNLAKPRKSLERIREILADAPTRSLGSRVRKDLATSVDVRRAT